MKRPKKKRRFMDRLLPAADPEQDVSKTSSDDEPNEEGDETMNGSDDREYKEHEEIEVQEGNETTGEHKDGSEPTTPVEVVALAQSPADDFLETDEEQKKAEQLAEISPDFFGQPREMSLDEIAQLVKDTDRQSEEMQKRTSKVLSLQFAMQPDLANKLKGRQDLAPHAGTIRRWKQAGDASHKLEKVGIDTTPLGTWHLQELSKAPNDKIMVEVARQAIAENLSVRDIRKKISPLVKKAKMEASGALTDMSPQCVEIIEGLEHPEKLMEQQQMVNLLQDLDRLKTEFTFTELSRIHEKANSAETRIEKQKRALEEKGGGYVPVINFLRLIRKTISAVFDGGKN